MGFVHKEIVIAELYSLFPSRPIFKHNRRKWEEKNAQYLECIRAVEKIPTVDKDYNKLIEKIEEQIQRYMSPDKKTAHFIRSEL